MLNYKKSCALIVTYNRPKLLIRALSSLSNQSVKLDNIIIVDNGSDEETFEYLVKNNYLSYQVNKTNNMYSDVLLEELIFGNIHYIKIVKNQGAAFGFHIGIKHFMNLTNSWLWIMDDDGYADNKAHEKLLKSTVENIDFLNCLVIDESDESKLSFGLFDKNSKKMIYDRMEVLKVSESNLFYDHANPFNGTYLSKKMLHKIGVPKFQFYGWGVEVELMLRARSLNFRVATVIDSIFFHPSSREKQVVIFNGKYRLNLHNSNLKNYCEFRNKANIQFNFQKKKLVKFFLLYCLYFIKTFQFHMLIFYVKATFHGVFNIWGKEKKFL
jgi:rhamnopyranosyl-N-acetylglucosaminyl-diphospho-decaprenol beta-1,3/1,4-galactofuranosyltransferase